MVLTFSLQVINKRLTYEISFLVFANIAFSFDSDSAGTEAYVQTERGSGHGHPSPRTSTRRLLRLSGRAFGTRNWTPKFAMDRTA